MEEKEEGEGRKGLFSFYPLPALPLLQNFRTRSQFRSLRVPLKLNVYYTG